MAKSGPKGDQWERDVAKIFSETFDDSFIRADASGGFIGGKNRFRKEYMTEGQIRGKKGDISPPDDWINFNVECKNYNDVLPFHHFLMDKDMPLIEEWISQTMDAATENDLNLIIFKITRKGSYIMFERKHENDFDFNRFVYYNDWIVTDFMSFLDKNKNKIKELATNEENNKKS